MHTLELTEWRPTRVPAGGFLDEALADRLAKFVHVEDAGRKNDHHYILTPKSSAVGLLRISGDLILHIKPKVPVQNLFGMIERVYDLPSLKFYSGIGYVEKIADIHERLAALFAGRVLQRLRLGLYAAYVDREEDSSVVRGRVDLPRTAILQSRGVAAVGCAYQLQTFDIDDNRILLWTLDRILRLGLQQDEAMARVRSARRALLGSVQLVEMRPQDCEGRCYHRLNADYAQLHALARFFLERMGPSVGPGDSAFVPFTVNMYDLFQRYVAACLRQHAPAGVRVSAQQAVYFRDERKSKVVIDIVLTHAATGKVLAILDCKYKGDWGALGRDRAEVVEYAALTLAPVAYLVYPYVVREERWGYPRGFEVRVVGVGELGGSGEGFARGVFAGVLGEE